jgi:4-amino-4-deoxy-L-arabinose transferase-like glycosyltransferase
VRATNSSVVGDADRWTVGAVLLGVAVRLVSLGFKLSDPLPFADAFFYGSQATAVREGIGFDELFTGRPTAEHVPLTQILLAPMSFAAGRFDVTDMQRITMTVLGIVSLVLFACVARRLLPGRLAPAAVLVAAIYPNIWLHDAIVMSETVALLLINATMLLLLEFRAGPTWWRAGALGIAAGLATLARAELALLAVIVACSAAWFASRRKRAATARVSPVAAFVLVGAGSMLTIAPWVIENLSRFDEPVLLSTNDGTTLLGANCPDSYFGSGTGSWSLFCLTGFQADTSGDPSVISRLRREEALDYVTEHPGRLPVVVLARVARTLDLFDPAGMVTGDEREDKFAWALWVGVVMWWILAPLAVVGLLRMPGDDRLVIIGPIVVVAVTTLVFYGSHRLRVPLEPSVVLAATYGVGVLIRNLRRTRVLRTVTT